jgi:general secretion pathway protein H
VNTRHRGFTLVELLVVVALIAIASGLASLALRDPAASQLEQEASRLAALLESGGAGRGAARRARPGWR